MNDNSESLKQLQASRRTTVCFDISPPCIFATTKWVGYILGIPSNVVKSSIPSDEEGVAVRASARVPPKTDILDCRGALSRQR